MSAENTLKDWFEGHGWPWKMVEHEAVFTVEEGRGIKDDLPGGHSKSLLVEDRDKKLFLIVAEGQARVDLKGLLKAVGARGRFSFAKEARMVEVLNLRPGSVTPLGLINDTERQIHQVILDAALTSHDLIWCHPLRNTASVGLTPDALRQFIAAHHGLALEVNVAAPPPPTGEGP